jgi:hypothetical protein
MNDQRLSVRLTNYWNLIRKEQVLPEYSKMNPSAVHDLWPSCLVCRIEVTATGAAQQFTFHAIGDGLKSIYNGQMLGKTVSAGQKHFQGAGVLKQLPTVLAKPEPLFDEGQFVNERSKVVKYRSCLLPFGAADGSAVTHVLAGLSWREF